MARPLPFAAALETAEIDRVVDNIPVMSRRQAGIYAILSGLAIAAIGLFAIVWFRTIAADPHSVVWIAATVLIAGRLGVWAARWAALSHMERPLLRYTRQEYRVAVVSTFVPEFEPLPMLEHTLRAMVALEGEHDTWLLDEGDAPEARALCAALGVRHFTRRGDARYVTADGLYRQGTKHGNYNAWLTEVGEREYDILVAFDPDHVPERRYLRHVLGYFDDASIAYVQPPQVYYNQEASFIARGAAEETYAYYSSDLMASYGINHPVVIGCHGAHRIAALRDVGGFPPHDAEDLYLTMLYRAHGWSGVYTPEILAMGTTPGDWVGYLGQQRRWARSLIDLKLRILPYLAGRMPVFDRVLNLLHGAYYLRPLLIPLAYLLLALMLVNGIAPPPAALGALIALAALLGIIDQFRHRFYLDPAFEDGVHWRALLLQFAKWPTVVMATIDAVSGRTVPYALTRKTAPRSKRWVLAPTHLIIAGFLAAAWGVGWVLHGTLAPSLTVMAALLVIVSIMLAITETRAFPPGVSLELHERRNTRRW